QVRDRADVEDDVAVCNLPQEAGILLRTNSVAQALGSKGLERTANRRCAGRFAGVWHRAQPLRENRLERGCIGLGRVGGLEAAEADADDAAVPVLPRVPDECPCLLERGPAEDVRGQPDLDAVALTRL